MTANEMFWELCDRYKAEPDRMRLYTHIVVDESQDLCKAELAFLGAYAQGGGKNVWRGLGTHLSNDEVIAIDQDPLGFFATRGLDLVLPPQERVILVFEK